MTTHSLGSLCSACGGVLAPDDCICGERHGYTYQEWDEWAKVAFPDHAHEVTP